MRAQHSQNKNNHIHKQDTELKTLSTKRLLSTALISWSESSEETRPQGQRGEERQASLLPHADLLSGARSCWQRPPRIYPSAPFPHGFTDFLKETYK